MFSCLLSHFPGHVIFLFHFPISTPGVSGHSGSLEFITPGYAGLPALQVLFPFSCWLGFHCPLWFIAMLHTGCPKSPLLSHGPTLTFSLPIDASYWAKKTEESHHRLLPTSSCSGFCECVSVFIFMSSDMPISEANPWRVFHCADKTPLGKSISLKQVRLFLFCFVYEYKPFLNILAWLCCPLVRVLLVLAPWFSDTHISIYHCLIKYYQLPTTCFKFQ